MQNLSRGEAWNLQPSSEFFNPFNIYNVLYNAIAMICGRDVDSTGCKCNLALAPSPKYRKQYTLRGWSLDGTAFCFTFLCNRER
jgi:hypothetical protein